MVALLLAVEQGHSALDVCAAPGGKTALLARAAGPAGLVVAADVNIRRLQLARENLARVQLKQVKWLAMDAAAAIPFTDRALFDRILVDVPCSGTGTLARNPEIRWRLRKEDLAELHQHQVAMLGRAVEHLARGGRLVYSTCSLEHEENEDAVAEALAGREEIARVDGRKALAPHMAEGVRPQKLFDSAGFFRALPSEHGTDGFFAAILERRPR
jgi:16S rRNA (cytosine967-C5)-methyltransferase